jgi:hypothetical protein
MAVDLSKIAEKTVGKPSGVDLSAIAKKTVAKKTTGQKILWAIQSANKFVTWSTWAEPKTFKQNLQEFASPVVMWLRWVANVWRNIGDFIWRTTGLESEESMQKSKQFDVDMTKKTLGASADTRLAKWSEKIGELAGQVALSAPIYWVSWPTSALGRLWLAAGRGALGTQAANIGWEWKLASWKETAIWAALWFGLEWAGMAAKWLYNKAFQSTKSSLAEKWVELSGKRPWELVMEQNVSARVWKALEQMKGKLQNTWKLVEKNADKTGTFKGNTIQWWLKQDIIKQLWFDKLPQGTKSTKDLLNKVSNIVDDYIPKWDMTWRELVQVIKNLNATLPDRLKGMGIENAVSSKWFTQALSKTLKKSLDDLVAKWWGEAGIIRELYKRYSKEKLVEEILKNENIRKTLGRQIVWAAWWWVIGATAWVSDFQQWDVVTWWLKVLAWMIAGRAALQAANNPTVLQTLWWILRKWSNKRIQAAWWTLASKTE